MPAKVQIPVRVKPKLAEQLKQLAERENRSITVTVEKLLETALSERKEALGVSLVETAVDKIIDERFRALSDRVSRLLAKSLLEAMSNRSLTIQLLTHHLGADTARAFNQQAYKVAVANSKKRVEELEEVLQAIGNLPPEKPDKK